MLRHPFVSNYVYVEYVAFILPGVVYALLHNEELHNLYSSPSIIRMLKSRMIRSADI
jgi:hypothetical protein